MCTEDEQLKVTRVTISTTLKSSRLYHKKQKNCD